MRALVTLVCVALSCVSLRAQTTQYEEYRLKAAFVYRFPQFVEWPARALDGHDSFQICVVTPDPFGSALQELTNGETLNGRPLAVRDISTPDALQGCHLLFVPGARAGDAHAWLTEAARRAVLTVGENPGFLDDGGMINLRLVDRRVRFEVNADAASRAGLKLSSQLLRLAIAVRGGSL